MLVTLLTESTGGRLRGARAVRDGTAIGYLVAAGSALWLIGAPTGAFLVALTPWVPDWLTARPLPEAALVQREPGVQP